MTDAVEKEPSLALLNSDAAAESVKSGDNGDSEVKMSRNQQKKLRRLERAISMRPEKRKQERERRKLNRKNNKAVRDGEDGQKVEIQRKSLKLNTMALSTNRQRVVIDCSFEPLMNHIDVRHLCKQLSYCYATNRRMSQCLQFYLTSCGGQTEELLNKSGLANWDVHRRPEFYMDVFADEPRVNLCYLTSDSPNELEDFDEKTVYIIGGFVDHNHHKSHCYKMALEKKISHGRLPIGKFMHMKTRPVLTVNQVFEIVCKYVECRDWKKAFVNALPKRKGAQTKEEGDDDDKEELVENDFTDEDDEEDDDESRSSLSSSSSAKKVKVDSGEIEKAGEKVENKDQISC
jgi:tRNA (guanine9-N1)-methyltransferase